MRRIISFHPSCSLPALGGWPLCEPQPRNWIPLINYCGQGWIQTRRSTRARRELLRAIALNEKDPLRTTQPEHLGKARSPHRPQ